jgi:glyoxylase-like metal-dependent hydrolase (beta-lactamase superfamily II)
MKNYICETCGTQFNASIAPPSSCPICMDERQYVAWDGQGWTTHESLSQGRSQRVGEERGLLALGVTPTFAIDQRAMLLPTDAGNILWESLPLVTPKGIEALRHHGGVDRIVISHPHFYASMVEWSEALGGVPIMLHEADRQWVQRSHPAIEWWSGDTLRLSENVTLIRCGGHFEGSTALHWANGPTPGGALLSGDALQVGADRKSVSFMYSYPNAVPMQTSDVVAMRDRLADFRFADVFGYTWGRNILGSGRAAVDASFARYLKAVRG